MVLVQVIERGSVVAPGLYGCPELCAQQFAKRPDAPDWLHDDLRKRGLWE